MLDNTRTFKVLTQDGQESISISIFDDHSIREDNLNLETWGSSIILAQQLYHIEIANLPASQRTSQSQSRDVFSTMIPVLELGAGTALVGVAAAAVWHTDVLSTDLPNILPGIQKNIDLNQKLCLEQKGNAACGALDWRQPGQLILQDKSVISASNTKAKVIVAADTVYDDEHPELLCSVAQHWLARDADARMLIAYPLRVAYLDQIRELWEKFEMAGLVSDRDGRATLPLTWDDEREIEWVCFRWNST